MTLQRSEELDHLVEAYVAAKKRSGNETDPEDGLTDFCHVVDDATGVEMISVGVELATEACGREIWYTHDGVTICLFFGPLDEVLAGVRRKLAELSAAPR